MAEGVVQNEKKQLRIATGAENAYMNGTGTAQPLGIFVANNSGDPLEVQISTGNTQQQSHSTVCRLMQYSQAASDRCILGNAQIIKTLQK